MKKILCVTSNFPRWAGDSTTPFILHLAQDLQSLGWQVDVLAPHAPMAARHEQINGVKVSRFRYIWPNRLQTVCYQGGALINLKQNPSNYLKLPALVFFEAAAVFKHLSQGDYDLVHSHWILPQGFTSILAAKALCLPHVLTVHGSDAFALRGKMLKTFKRCALCHADSVTVNSSATEQQVRTIAPTMPELELIPMGISTNEPDQQRSCELRAAYKKGAGPLLIFVGRLVEEKGADDLLAAVALLCKTLPDTTALILGTGQNEEALKKSVQQLGISDRIFFIGWVEQHDIPTYLAAADIFVGPSKQSYDGRHEAQGLSFLEAMFAGIPVIASSIGGIKDTVIHEKTGLLIPENSPSSIAESVIRLVQDKNLKNLLVTQARKVSNKFTRKICATRFSRLFEKQIEKKTVSTDR
ncbi:Glycosyltransferase involved in cell wall bisynthesis [Candidatus Electrothrix aarhusensis]|uniref:Glycosyltransferase involved in cell wall bisynthesis n=1 Tax=Candidatus Electrothrix aarhusensis TaxID=1859131 RepID=A0A3S3QT35_9BACT|nr:Glycosyltransferase involved in cell wall bisynthesis [Candidatus Electrothrix aarhusensis]